MSENHDYTPPKVWQWDKPSGGQWEIAIICTRFSQFYKLKNSIDPIGDSGYLSG